MNKICIVKLRKKMRPTEEPGPSFKSPAAAVSAINELPMLVSEQAGMQAMPDERIRREGNGTEMDKMVTLTLTQQQMNALGSNPHLTPLLNGKFMEGIKAGEHIGSPLVIKFQFAAMIPLRLLKSSEVVQMLRISKNYLGKIVREGKLKSYNIGKLRRFLLDDILSYLHNDCTRTDLPQNSIAKTPRSGLSERSFQKE